MKACVLKNIAPIEQNPRELVEVPEAEPDGDQVRVQACGIYRTDLHLIEGKLLSVLEIN